MPFNIQGPELIIILIIALIIIGPGKLPDVGAALGKSLREFRKASSEAKDAASLEPAKVEPSRADAASVAPVAPAVAAPAAPEDPVAQVTASGPDAPMAAPEAPMAAPVAPSAVEQPSEPGR